MTPRCMALELFSSIMISDKSFVVSGFLELQVYASSLLFRALSSFAACGPAVVKLVSPHLISLLDLLFLPSPFIITW